LAASRAVNWVEHHHLRALGQGRFGLLLLLRRVLIRVRVEIEQLGQSAFTLASNRGLSCVS